MVFGERSETLPFLYRSGRTTGRIPLSEQPNIPNPENPPKNTVTRLQARAAMHVARAEAVDGPAGVRRQPAGRRMRRCQSRLFGSLLRTINLLTEAQRRPNVVVERPKSAKEISASPTDSRNCERIRNEPNADPGSGAGTLRTGAIRASADGDSVGWVQPTGCQALPSVGFTHPTPRNVAATPVVPMSCERMWNEANAPDGGTGFDVGN
jgi:hypothetical protein